MKKVKLARRAIEAVAAQVAFELLGQDATGDEEEVEPNERLKSVVDSVAHHLLMPRLAGLETALHARLDGLYGKVGDSINQAVLRGLGSSDIVREVQALRHELLARRSAASESLTTEAEVRVMKDRCDQALARADAAEKRGVELRQEVVNAVADKLAARKDLHQIAVRTNVLSSRALANDAKPEERALLAHPEKLLKAIDARLVEMGTREKKWLEGSNGVTERDSIDF